MKLKNQKYGPVTMRNIDYAPNMSQETVAFTATVKVDGVGEAHVRNSGHGGENLVEDRKVNDALEAYCKTLPDHKFKPMFGGDEGWASPMSVDLFITLLIGRAVDQKGGQPAACDGCGNTDHWSLNERTDLPGVVRGKTKGLWFPCVCDSCNDYLQEKSSAS